MTGRYYSSERNRSCHSVLRNYAENTLRKSGKLIFTPGEANTVQGMHNHFRTADDRVSKNGTAYITNTDMTGPFDSFTDIKTESSVSRFLCPTPGKDETDVDNLRISGAVIKPDSGTRNPDERMAQVFKTIYKQNKKVKNEKTIIFYDDNVYFNDKHCIYFRL